MMNKLIRKVVKNMSLNESNSFKDINELIDRLSDGVNSIISDIEELREEQEEAEAMETEIGLTKEFNNILYNMIMNNNK